MNTIDFLAKPPTQTTTIILTDDGSGSFTAEAAYHPPLLTPESAQAPCVKVTGDILRLLEVSRLLENRNAVFTVVSRTPPPEPADDVQRIALADLLGAAWRTGRKAELAGFIEKLHARQLVPNLDPESWNAETLRAVRGLFLAARKSTTPNP